MLVHAYLHQRSAIDSVSVNVIVVSCCPKKILFTRNISCSRHLNLFHNFQSPLLAKVNLFLWEGGRSLCCVLLSVVSVAVRRRVNCKAFSIETGFTFTSARPGSANRTSWTSRLPPIHREFCLFCPSFHSAELLRMSARDLSECMRMYCSGRRQFVLIVAWVKL